MSDHHDRQTIGSSDRLSNLSSDCPIRSPIVRLSDHRLMAADCPIVEPLDCLIVNSRSSDRPIIKLSDCRIVILSDHQITGYLVRRNRLIIGSSNCWIARLSDCRMVRSTGCLIFGSADRRIVESSGHYDGQTAGSSNHRFMTLRSSNCSIVGSSDCRIIGLLNREAVCRIVTPTVGLSDHPMVRSSESRIV